MNSKEVAAAMSADARDGWGEPWRRHVRVLQEYVNELREYVVELTDDEQPIQIGPDSDEIAAHARREEREHIAKYLRTLTRWCDGTEMEQYDQWTMAMAANEVLDMSEEASDE
jgi:hypothetical protein